MKIEVNEIDSIKPGHFLSSELALEIDVILTTKQMENVFCQIWEVVGDEGINSWLDSEGYSLVRNEI